MAEPSGEFRRDPLTREWVNIVGHRQARPNLPDAGCPFCVGGLEAPEPYDVRWFENRWPPLAPGPAIDAESDDPVVAVGASEVVLFSPTHNASLSTLPVDQVRKVVDLWTERTEALLARAEIEYVLVFENRGREVGATIDHPHGQIYAFPFVPPAPANEAAVCREHGCALCEELTDVARVVTEHGDWVAYVPAASGYPYGMRFAPRRHVGSLAALEDASRDALAALLVDALGRYDHLWNEDDHLWNEDDHLWNEEHRFPYLLWFHQAPAAGGDEYHVHAHVAPPLRAPGVARYVASGELGSGTLSNPVVPEDAARALRDAR
jgi:UDPglucose--hexose-1-phosphate uridylyltransferase